MGITVKKDYPTQVFFEGNSLMNHAANAAAVNGQYICSSAYSTVIAQENNCSAIFLAQSGRRQSYINDAFDTNVRPYARANDIIVLWEGTNDMGADGLTAAEAWNNVLTYIGFAASVNSRLIICTVIARDGASDAADLMTRIDAYNGLVRDNSSAYGYSVCDIAANTNFNDRDDCSISPPYHTDKIHLLLDGQNIAHPIISNSILDIF